MGNDSMRTRQALVSTVREIVRSPGVQYLRHKERERVKKREKAKRRFSITKNPDPSSLENKNLNSKKENFNFVDNSDDESGGNNFENFKLTLSVPFLHSQEKYVDDVCSDNNGTDNTNNDDINTDGNEIMKNGHDERSGIKIDNSNDSNNNDSNENNRISHLERAALHCITNTISSLAPTSDGWTTHSGAPKPFPPGPFLPLFCLPEKDTKESTFLTVKKSEIPCSGPGSPIPNRSSGN